MNKLDVLDVQDLLGELDFAVGVDDDFRRVASVNEVDLDSARGPGAPLFVFPGLAVHYE